MVETNHHIPNEEWPLIKKFNLLQSLSHDEIDVLMKLHEQEIIIDANKTFIYQKSVRRKCFIVNSGWACRFLNHSNGARQIIEYYLPGDIISPFALVMPKANYSVSSISCLHVSVFKPDALIDLCTAQPKLALRYLAMLGWQDAMFVDLATGIGWRTAYQRTAYFLLNLFERLKLVEKTVGNTFFAPLTQQMLADTLGLSIVHMNRTIKKLREDELIKIESNLVKLLDLVRLIQVAEYQSFYWRKTQQSSSTGRHQRDAILH
ncbi:MAG: Crp/Fnr family transcriptional regulator [Nitrosomonas sp.]|nr:MAG: Crp/Fnr family transcriptional regulator [Nitrosomonas sp.]